VDHQQDALVFRRWTEDGLDRLREDVENAIRTADVVERHGDNLKIIYGSEERKGKADAKL